MLQSLSASRFRRSRRRPPRRGPQGAGLTASCRIVNGASGTLECDFPHLPPDKGLEIRYVSAECAANGGTAAAVSAFQILTTPPNATAAIAFQVPIPATPNSFSGSPTAVWTTGDNVNLYARAGSAPIALLYMGSYATHTPGLTCTVSLSGVTF